MSYHRALMHASKASFYTAALVEEMLATSEADPSAEAVAELLLRVDDVVAEAESARSELGDIHYG